MTLRVKTGDTVKLLAGKDRGKTGKVIQTFPKLGRVVVEGLNACKRHLRTNRQGEKGQTVEFFMPINASNVRIVGEDGMARRHKQRNRTKVAKKKDEQHSPKKEATPPKATQEKAKTSVEGDDK